MKHDRDISPKRSDLFVRTLKISITNLCCKYFLYCLFFPLNVLRYWRPGLREGLLVSHLDCSHATLAHLNSKHDSGSSRHCCSRWLAADFHHHKFQRPLEDHAATSTQAAPRGSTSWIIQQKTCDWCKHIPSFT
jgi:hypothetical protein